MGNQTTTDGALLAKNLRQLMKFFEWSEHRLAKESGISQKTINNILNQETSPRLETLDRLAAAFNLSGWQIMLPELSPELLAGRSIGELVNFYSKATAEGRDYIYRIAEKEAGYGTK